MLGAALDLIVRLDTYTQRPYSLCGLCRKWFPTTFLNACHELVHAADDELDAGLSLPLRALARQQGSEMEAVAWLQSSPVQEFLTDTCSSLLVNSLDAERHAAEAKGWAAHKVSQA